MSTTLALAPVETAMPSDLIGAVREARGRAQRAETDVYELALAWADAHPALPGQEVWHAAQLPTGSDVARVEEAEWFGIPGVRWDAPAAFAAANAMSTTAGRAFLRDALVLRHRLPRLHARVVAGHVPIWRARRVAAVVLGRPADVVAYLDAAVAESAEALGVAALDRVLDEAMLRLYPEQRELEQFQALDSRHATLDERSINHTGIADMWLRADLPDLQDFDRALSEVAAALARHTGDEPVESLDVRRAQAIGVLADPAAALALLQVDEQWATQVTRRRVELVIHLSEGAVGGSDPVTHPAQPDRPQLVESVREWCARPGTRINVRPVLDLREPILTDSYRPTATQVAHVALRDRHCVFPHCTRPARDCDTDHVEPYVHDASGASPPGQTDTRNLTPLCRHHHRLKTHAGWRLNVIAPATYLWTDPHGQVFLRDPDGGTRDLTR